MERTVALRDILSGLDLTETLNSRVRNTIEHFDEYLDEASLRLTDNPPSPMAAYNMAFSHWEVTSPRVYPLKMYVVAERRFYNLDHSIDLGRLRDEAAAILDRLLTSGVLQGVDNPGGLMIRLPDAEQANKSVHPTARSARGG